MKMTILEGRIEKMDVRDYPECEGEEIRIEFPDPHVEMILDLGEATKLSCLLGNAIQDICYVREESKRHGN